MASLRKQRDSWIVDFYLCGQRFRKAFRKKENALRFKHDFDHLVSIKSCTLDRAIRLYIKFETILRKCKGNQITERKYFWEFKTFLKTKGIEEFSQVTEIEPVHMQAFQVWLKNQKHNGKAFKNSTVNRRFHTVKHFFTKLIEWGYLNVSPARFIKALPEARKSKRLWADCDVALVSKELLPKDRLLFLFLYLSGARLSTAIRLTWFDLDMVAESMVLTSKKGRASETKEYRVPMSSNLKELLKSIPKTSEYVFPITAGLFSKRVGRAIAKLNLKGLNLHGLRHTFASNVHKKGASTETIRLLLGHSNTKTTEGYLTTDLDHLRKFVS